MVLLFQSVDFVQALLNSVVDPHALQGITIKVADRDAELDIRKTLQRDFSSLQSIPTVSDPNSDVVSDAILVYGVEINFEVSE